MVDWAGPKLSRGVELKRKGRDKRGERNWLDHPDKEQINRRKLDHYKQID
jgi:hypothetical protein